MVSRDQSIPQSDPFAELVGIDAESLASGIDFERLGERLQNSLKLVPFLQ